MPLEDWDLVPLTEEQQRDMLELLDDRYRQRLSQMVTNQMPVNYSHELTGDRSWSTPSAHHLTHKTCQIKLKGELMRKRAK